jgi:hypothetical protein
MSSQYNRPSEFGYNGGIPVSWIPYLTKTIAAEVRTGIPGTAENTQAAYAQKAQTPGTIEYARRILAEKKARGAAMTAAFHAQQAAQLQATQQQIGWNMRSALDKAQIIGAQAFQGVLGALGIR